MKKDVVLALSFGLGLGALIAVLAVKIPLFLENRKPDKKFQTEKKQLSPTPPVVTTKLTIKEPSDQSILNSVDVSLKGQTDPETIVIIESPNDSQAIESDKNGSFSAKLKLSEGGNPVVVTAVDSQGNEETKTLNLFYTDEKI